MEVIKNRILSTLLFCGAPFYFYPPKAMLNKKFGCDYELAYYHFRQNHRNGVNLSLHLICFFVQIIGNFCLLAEIDRRFIPQHIHMVLGPSHRQFSLVSATVWTITNFFSAAPKYVSLLTGLCLAGAYTIAPYVTPELMDHGAFGGFLLMLTLSHMATGASIVSMPDMAKVFVGMPILFAAFQYAEQNYFEFMINDADKILKVSLGFVVAVPLLLRNPLKPLVILSVFCLRAAYIASGDKLLFFLGYGFFASFMQGITHFISKEEATLIAMERKGDSAKISFEYGHVTYFPNLAINSIIDSILGRPTPVRPKSEQADTVTPTTNAGGADKNVNRPSARVSSAVQAKASLD